MVLRVLNGEDSMISLVFLSSVVIRLMLVYFKFCGWPVIQYGRRKLLPVLCNDSTIQSNNAFVVVGCVFQRI